MMLSGMIYSAVNQGGDSVVLILNHGISKSFELIITLAPIMCFWCGITAIAEASGITQIISKALSPVTAFLFEKKYKDTPAMETISLNMSANMLGMGNAATPLGLSAMSNLDKLNPTPHTASNAMCMFIIINTASIQLIPSSVIVLRSQYGAINPSDIIIPSVITTITAFSVATLSAKLCEKVFKL